MSAVADPGFSKLPGAPPPPPPPHAHKQIRHWSVHSKIWLSGKSKGCHLEDGRPLSFGYPDNCFLDHHLPQNKLWCFHKVLGATSSFGYRVVVQHGLGWCSYFATWGTHI